MARLISAKRQPEFDRDAEFVVLRPVTARARDYRKGEPFDKTGVTVRTLRALYDQRKITDARSFAAQAPAPRRPTSRRAIEMFELAQRRAAAIHAKNAQAAEGPREPAAPVKEPPPDDEDEERRDQEPSEPPAELIVKRGGAGGGYGVYRGDVRVEGPLSKAKAYERLDALRKAGKRASRRTDQPERQPAA